MQLLCERKANFKVGWWELICSFTFSGVCDEVRNQRRISSLFNDVGLRIRHRSTGAWGRAKIDTEWADSLGRVTEAQEPRGCGVCLCWAKSAERGKFLRCWSICHLRSIDKLTRVLCISLSPSIARDSGRGERRKQRRGWLASARRYGAHVRRISHFMPWHDDKF